MGNEEISGRAEDVSSLIARRQAELGLTDEHLARAVGYGRGAVIAMMPSGDMRLPLNKVVSMADALQVPRAQLFEQVLRETSPDLMDVLAQIYPALTLTPTENRLLEHVRSLPGRGFAAPIVFNGAGVIALVSVT